VLALVAVLRGGDLGRPTGGLMMTQGSLGTCAPTRGSLLQAGVAGDQLKRGGQLPIGAWAMQRIPCSIVGFPTSIAAISWPL
jgi:hypothetical protein